jgi:cobaltochelatase CobN
MTARMLETIRKDFWEADAETERRLLEEFIDSVNGHGASGSEVTTGNARLLEYVLDQALEHDLPIPDIERFQQVMETAMGIDIRTAADQLREFVRMNELPQVTASEPEPETPPLADAPPLEGFRMTETRQSAPAPESTVRSVGGGNWDGLWVGLPVLGLLVAWRWRRGVAG